MATATLKIKITTAGTSRTFNVSKVTATLGSAAHCDVRLAHASVDGEHARLWQEGGRLWLQDLGSKEGTFLNGSRLPALKPMLIRPLVDILKLAACGDELSFEKPEVSPVRAPRVAAAAPVAEPAVPEMTLTDMRTSPFLVPPEPATPAPADQGLVDQGPAAREERARVARDLAEMRLQLQMAELERTGAEDLRRHVNQLRADVQGLEDERRDMARAHEAARAEEALRLKKFEADLIARREDAEIEIREMRDVQGRKLGHWKLDVVSELNAQVHGLLADKVRAWVTRPLSNDMVLELEHELDAIFRALVLEEDPHGGAVGEITRTQIVLPPPIEAPAPVVAEAPAESQIRMAIGHAVARRPNTLARRVAVTGLFVTVLGLGLEVYRVTHPTPDRTPATQVAAPAPWRPIQDRKLKTGYVDNVVSTSGYVELMTSPAWQTAWTSELERGAPAWKVDPRVITSLAEREVNLIVELKATRDRTREGAEGAALALMRVREAEVTAQMLADLGGNAAILAKYQALKRPLLIRLLPH